MKSIRFFKGHYILATLAILLAFVSCKKKEAGMDASGTFESTEIIVSSEATGKIMEFNVEEGQTLANGQKLGYIDTTQLYLKKRQLLVSVKATQSRRPDVSTQIAGLQQQIATAESEKQRVERLLKGNAANQKQLDDIDAQIKLLKRQLNAQKSTLESTDISINDESSAMKIQADQIDDQLEKSHIVSPIKGTVLAKYAEAGELATPGKPLFKIADMDNMILRAYITAGQLAHLKIGQRVKISAEFGENETREYDGTVSWISSKSEFTPKTIQTKDERANLVYAVKVMVKNDGYLKIGMYGGFKLGK